MSEPDIKNLAEKAINDENYLSELLDDLTEKCEQRWPSFKILKYLSEKNPDALYPKWNHLEDLFKKGNSYTKYATIYIIANLTKIDKENKFENFFDDYFGEIDTTRTVTAAHVIVNASKIAKAKPKIQDKIIKKLLDIDRTHKGKQKEMMKGYAIEAFSEFYDEIKDKNQIINFVKQQLESACPKTRKQAKEFLKKWEK
jgi:hypothetical protein